MQGEQATAPARTERPIFAAVDGRRARRVRLAAAITVAVVALWVVGLAAGVVGFGGLTGVPIGGGGGTGSSAQLPG